MLLALQKCAQRAAGMVAACAHVHPLTLRRLQDCPSVFSGLVACTQLSHLTLDNLQLQRSEAPAALCELVAGLPALLELSICSLPAAPFASSPSVLQRITCLCQRRGDTQWMQQLQGQPSPCLRLHTLELTDAVSLSTIKALSSCPQLRQLTVGGLLPEEGDATVENPFPSLLDLTIRCFSLHAALQHPWIAKVGCLPCLPTCLHM
jgi:hypothetical protein